MVLSGDAIRALDDARRFRHGPPTVAGRAAGPPGPRAPARPAADPLPLRTDHRTFRDRRPVRRVGCRDRRIAPSGRRRLVSTSPTPDRHGRGGDRAFDHHLLRIRWGGQDDHGGGPRPRGGAPRAKRLRGDHRPRSAAGERPRPRRAHQPAHSHRGGVARSSCTRSCSTPRRRSTTWWPGTPTRRSRPSDIKHQPHLPQPHELAVRNPGVHGGGEALRAHRGGRFRRRGRGHTADPQRARLPRRPWSPDPVPREPGLPGADEAHPGRAASSWAWRPTPCCGPSPGWPVPTS